MSCLTPQFIQDKGDVVVPAPDYFKLQTVDCGLCGDDAPWWPSPDEVCRVRSMVSIDTLTTCDLQVKF